MATSRQSNPNPSLQPAVIIRLVLTVVAVAAALALLWLLRTPLLWLLLAALMALALSAPVSYLSRHMKRGFAIALTYIIILLIPLAILALILPPLVGQTADFVAEVPQYADDAKRFIEDNPNLQGLQQDFQLGDKLQEQAQALAGRLGDAAGVLKDIGFGLANSLFALTTILILAAFMLGSGDKWATRLINRQAPARRPAFRRAARRIATSVSNYVGGVLLIATIAGLSSFIVLLILGVPFAGPLAILMALLSLIPLIGATVGAVIVGIVTVFANFPTATIVWVIWAIVYQQLENNLVQPQVQKRAVNMHPFAVIVAVLFGSTLLGVLGAVIAIPLAASLLIAYQEWSRLQQPTRRRA